MDENNRNDFTGAGNSVNSNATDNIQRQASGSARNEFWREPEQNTRSGGKYNMNFDPYTGQPYNNSNTTNNPYYNYYAGQQNGQGANPPKPEKEKKPRKKLSKKSLVAILLACALLLGLIGGTGGALIVGKLTGSNGTVMWKSTSSPVKESDDGDNDDDDGMNTSEVAAKVKDSVVEIKTETVSTDSFFQNYVTSGAGSGVVISDDGYIVTNNHVIDGASKINVTFSSNEDKSYEAKLIGTDKATDIAVIKIEVPDKMKLTVAAFGNSDSLIIGESVLAVGNPLGELGGTVTKGIVSALSRQLIVENQTMTLLQIDASISPGNSGGGLFNSRGELVGIVNAKSSGTGVEGLGFAIPVNTASEAIEDIIKYGYVKGRAQLGVTTVEISDIQTAYMYGVSELGVYIYSVNDNSGAEKAGLQSGDRIVSINGKQINSYSDISAFLQKKSVGDKVKLTYSRGGSEKTVSITLQESTPQNNKTSQGN